jgi:hypothetical protein
MHVYVLTTPSSAASPSFTNEDTHGADTTGKRLY